MNQQATNKELYETLVLPVVNSFLEGVNGTVMVYGPTGSGKTYTMIGDENKREELRSYKNIETIYNSNANGVLLCAMENILQKVLRGDDKCTCILKCSYIEVYNDFVYDLLQEKGMLQTPLTINELDSKEFVLKGGIEWSIRSAQDFFEAIKRGEGKFLKRKNS